MYEIYFDIYENISVTSIAVEALMMTSKFEIDALANCP